MKCVLHFSNGVFNSLAPVKRGDDVDQLRKTEWTGESEREAERVHEPHGAFGFSCQEKHQLSSAIFHLERFVVCAPEKRSP